MSRDETPKNELRLRGASALYTKDTIASNTRAHGMCAPSDEVRKAVQATMTHPLNLDSDSQLLDYTGPKWLWFDDQGMVLPHSILGSLGDFRSYLEAKGETDLLKRIPSSFRDPPSRATEKRHSEAVEKRIPSGDRNIQSNALQRWDTHMRLRRRQQDVLSDLLDRPVEHLLMNQADRFRETQEQREFLNHVLPLIHSGYGYRVGSEFWSIPRRYGDEMSGITATLTQSEQGRWEPVTHVGLPNSIRQESGIVCPETLRPASQTWDRSAYLQHQLQELGGVLPNIRKPDISGLEVIGSGKPSSVVTVCRSPLLEKEDKEREHKVMKKDIDPLARYDDVLIPSLRFCGQLASWTGNSTKNQGEIGISATILFEALTGEIASSSLELQNEGRAAIFYSWKQLRVPHSFPHPRPQTNKPHFYFSSSSGVIRPSETQQVEFVFKSDEPGISTELWQLNTHPVLLQGASMQVTLRGVSLYQDKTADQRLYISTKLEKIVSVKICRSIVYEMLQALHTPERPSSPPELYITKEQRFQSKNPQLQYLDQPVEELKSLWQEVNQGHTWDFSVDTLRQVLLSLPDEEPTQDSLTKEEKLAQLNSVFLQLSEPTDLKHNHLTAATIGQQLWVKLLDEMTAEAHWLRSLLGLPEREMCNVKEDKSIVSDADLADSETKNEEKGGVVAKVEKNRARSTPKDDNKRESKSPALTDKSTEGKRRDEVGKASREKLGKKSASLTDTHSQRIIEQPPDIQSEDPEVTLIYTRLLHRKVYALMEDLVDNLCDLMDELSVGDERHE
uniref:Mycbp associated protein n=1 Tax=Acanthochromis polyacanthus TaxID=80966 RepID=A0A3Q1H7C0_9TELE